MNANAKRAKEIFLEVVKIAPNHWEAYLTQACAGDRDLRGLVDNLLDAHKDAGSFLDAPALAATLDEPISERPGTVIGPYKLMEQIGAGGMGLVFVAEQQYPIRRKVALKVIKPGMDTRQVVARFEAERQALALMDHANIAKVLDGGETAGSRPYFVMELVKGVTISEYSDQNHLPIRERLELFLDVCQAVQHAHQKGIIHRDLKPTNVMVTSHDGKPVVKVIDFGVAKAIGQQLTDKTVYTQFAQLVGTPLYMSPEQAGQSGLDVDTRSDIYSLGVLLYELLAGTTPFDKERFQELSYDEMRRIIREEEPPKPSTRLSTLGLAASTISTRRKSNPKQLSQLFRGDLDWIVMKCLEKDRNRRYETVNGLAMDLRRFLHDEPVLARPPSTAYRFGKFARRNKAALATATVITLLLVVVSAVTTIAAFWLNEQRKATDEQLRETQKAQRQGQHRLYESKLAEARAKRLSRQPGQRLESLAALREAAQLAGALDLGEEARRELRDEAIVCFALTDVRLVQPEWAGFPLKSTGSPGFDADLGQYARGNLDGTISVRHVADDQELARLTSPGPGPGPDGASWTVFSPDGSLLAARYWRPIPGSSTNLRVWDWRRGQVVFQPSFPTCSVRFSPDGRQFALAQPDGTITLHDSARGNELQRWSTGLDGQGLAFNPDGSQLAIAGYRGRKVRIHDPTSGKLLRELEAGANLGTSIAWHPEGTLIAVGGERGQVYLWDTATGRPHAVLNGHDGHAAQVAFVAGGAVLVSSSDDGTTRLWDPWAGDVLLRLPGGLTAVSRDGRRFVIQTGTDLGHWELVCSSAYRTLPRCKSSGGVDLIHNTSFSPDGRWLLGGGTRGVWLWDMAADSPGVLLPLSWTNDAQFHPRREELFTSGGAGLFHWQARVQDGVLRIGPKARCLADPSRLGRFSLDWEGRQLTVAEYGDGGGARVFNLDNPGAKVLTLPHGNTSYTATSPDGKWIATGTHNGFGVKLWEARTGKEQLTLMPDERLATVTFSPDSRWLVTGTTNGLDLWDVSGNWVREILRAPRRNFVDAQFSPDGALLAATLGLCEVQLIDTATWLPAARLRCPDGSVLAVGRSAFSPDGSQLAVFTIAGNLRVWDLRRIRMQLCDLGLDWHLPAYPPDAHAGAQPMRVEVDVSEFQRYPQAREHLRRGDAHSGAKRWREAVAEYAKALELKPDYAMAANNFAWLLVTCPQEELHDAPRAVALAQQAVRLEPRNGTFWNTLGVARYRAREWQSALAALEKSILHQGGNSWDWFFLAMAHWQLGDKEKARMEYEQAMEWMAKKDPKDDELLRFRAEAEGLVKNN